MDKNFKNIDELLQQTKKELLYRNLVEQIEKDFTRANIPFDLPSEVSPFDLKKLIHEKIYMLIMEKFNEYLNLLYIIDVPEKAFKEIEVTDAVEIAEHVSVLIFKREFQKVRLKAKYS